jgi:hypothetical protein
MTKSNTSHLAITSLLPSPQEAFDDVRDSFERFRPSRPTACVRRCG